LPISFGGSSIAIVDSAGKSVAAPLLYVSPTQINFQVPAGVSPGTAQVTITSSDGTKSTASVTVATIAPGIFTLNNTGLAAADILRISGGVRTIEPVYSQNSAGAIVASPINLGPSTDQVYLELYGTGFQAGTTVRATVGGVTLPVLYAGPQRGFAGLDQIDLALPVELAGKGNVSIQFTAGGVVANTVQVTIQ